MTDQGDCSPDAAAVPARRSALPAALAAFLQRNGVQLDRYAAQLAVDVPRFIRLNPFAVLDLGQLGAGLGCAVRATALADFFALPGQVRLAPSASYRLGQCYGIDLASGVAVDNLDLEPGLAVLDLCCAPGAKLAMICDRIGRRGAVVGVDVSAERLNVTRRQILGRYGLGAVPDAAQLCLQLVCADGSQYDSEARFDRVLVDAECTHDGSLKHIVKFSTSWGWESLERRFLDPDRVGRISDLQRRLLANGYRLLKAGGVLIYSTCSFCVAQNEDVVQALLDQHGGGARLLALNAATCAVSAPGVGMPLARRLDPVRSNTSALFIAKITKLPPP